MKTLWIYLAVIYNVQARLNIKEGYFFGQEVKADYDRSDLHILTTSHDVNLDVCTKQCLGQPRCDFINYKYRSKMCYLIEHFNKNSTVWFSNETGSVLGEKTKWNRNSSHPETSMAKTACSPPPNILHVEKFGNMHTTGSKVLYRRSKLHNKTSTLTCSSTGQWKWDQKDFDTPICLPDQYNIHGDFCYVFLWNVTVKKSEAEDMCTERNGSLATIKNKNKQDFIRKILRMYENLVALNKINEYTKFVWLGLSDSLSEGQFRWTRDNTTIDFNNWLSITKEPNGEKNENCVVLWSIHNYSWADYGCNKRALVLCEIDITL